MAERISTGRCLEVPPTEPSVRPPAPNGWQDPRIGKQDMQDDNDGNSLH